MYTVRRNFLAGCSLGALVLMIPNQAAAQDAAPTQDPVAQGAVNSSNADIIVTANKREQNLNKVGSSVAAFSGETLVRQRVDTITDLAKITPGLTATTSPNALPVYTLRGVGFYEFSLSAYPDVSVYMDQVPLSLSLMSSLVAFDLERVEVLKGPQGTLFGNNATGGAINFVAAKPTSEFHSGMELSYGRFNTFQGQGFISGPITDTLGARIAIKGVKSGDWQRSYTRNDTLGSLNNIAGRLVLDWEPTDSLKFSLNLNGWRDKNQPQAPQQIGIVPQFPFIPPAALPAYHYPLAPANARAADWGPAEPRQNNSFRQAALRGDYEFGSLTLTSLTGISRTKLFNFTDYDGTALAASDLGPAKGKIDSFTQELRLSSDPKNPLRWVLGANYERTNVSEQRVATFADAGVAQVLGITRVYFTNDQWMRNYAAFGNVEYEVTDQLTLKAGARYTEAKRRSENFDGDNPAIPVPNRPDGSPGFSLTDFFNGAYGAIYGGAVPLIIQNESVILDNRTNPDGSPVDPTTYLKTGIVHTRLNEHNTSWSVGADYKPNDDLLLYANVSKGYKAGSVPIIGGSLYTAFAPVKQEELLSYEAGFKAQLADKKVSISGAAFYYDYTNKQLRAKFVDFIFGILDKLANVPKSRVKGAEISVLAQPLTGLSLSGSATYLDAKVKRYEGIIGQTQDANGFNLPLTASFAGTELPFAPKLQYALRADYDFPLSDTLAGFIGVGVTGQTKSIGVLALTAADKKLYKLNAYTLVDGNIGIQSADGQYRLSLWGKNIFNKYYWSNTIQNSDEIVRYASRPAEYGVTLSIKM